MERENVVVEVNEAVKSEETILTKPEITPTHALGLQDLYKAAFSQEPVTNFTSFTEKTTLVGAAAVEVTSEKYFATDKSKNDEEFKSSGFDDAYQLYTLKGLQYSVDFGKPQGNSLDLNELNYEAPKVDGVEVLTTAAPLSRPFDAFPNDANSVLDLDKGIQIHLVKADGTSSASAPSDSTSLAYSYETCEYTGDAQILHRYLSDSAFLKDGASVPCQPVGTVTVNFVNKNSANVPGKVFCDSNSVGVNPEALGVRFEDCEFNSSDSFASTESIIPKNIKCPKCPKKFMFKSDLLRHDKHKHSVKPKLFCKFCNKEFVSQQNLLFHEKSHKKKRSSFKCDACKKMFKKSALLVKHMMKKHSRSAPFSCSQCGKVFASQVLLNNHFRKVHLSDGDKPYKCDVCSKSFEKKQGLSCHAKAHLLEDHPHVCQYCNKSFSKICYLKNHQKSHLNEERDSFVCDACGKDFKSSTALEEHSRKHTGEKPFTCNVCMKRFAYKPYFKLHVKKHAEVKEHACTLCQKSFASAAELTKHEKTHGKEKGCQCAGCGLEFGQQSQLVAHRKKQKCSGAKAQKNFLPSTATSNFADAGLENVTLQNVNVIVDQAFANQQPIVLTSFINSNSVPVILTQNPSGPYSVSSIT